MIRQCERCHWWYDDEFRSTLCTHETFAANDGRNNFAHHPESYKAPVPPTVGQSGGGE